MLSVCLRDRAGNRSEPAAEALREVVARRESDWQTLMSQAQLDRVIDASGGQLRDLFLLLREVIGVTVTRRADHPVADDIIETAIGNVGSQFGLITAENAELLRAIDAADGVYEPPGAAILQVADLLQTHVLLVHRNGTWWWEIHPLARAVIDGG